MRASDVANVLGSKNKDGQRQVNSRVARVWTLPDVAILKNTELLLAYGEDFWKAKKYCQYCFKRSVCANNPLVLCSGHSQGKQCDIARHRLCFNQAPALSDLNNAEVKYFCPDHLMHAASPGVSSKPKAAPRAAAAFSNPAFTPPPKVAPITTRKRIAEPDWSPLVRTSAVRAGNVDGPASVNTPTASAAAAAATAPTAAGRSARRLPPSSAAAAVALPNPAFTPIKSTLHPPSTSAQALPRPSTKRSIAFVHSAASASSKSRARRSSSPSVDVAAQPLIAPLLHRAQAATAPERESFAGWASDSDYECDSDSESNDSSGASSVNDNEQTNGSPMDADEMQSVIEVHALISPTGHGERAPLKTRAEEKAQELPDYQLHSSALTDAMWGKCLDELTDHAKRSPRPWYIPKQEVKQFKSTRRTKQSCEQAAAAAALPVRASSVVAMEIDDAPEAAGAAAAVEVEKTPTSNRWRTRKSLAHDWAEYRACCGDPNVWGAQMNAVGLGPLALAQHCSLSVRLFFAARLKHRQMCYTRKTYDLHVANSLRHGKPTWEGFDVCSPCFRALLGISRATLFEQMKKLLAPAGRPDPSDNARRAQKRDHAVNVLRSFAKQMGQNAPNATGESRVRLPQKRYPELAIALSEFEKSTRGLAAIKAITEGTTRRAVQWLEKHENLFISLGTGTTLCRCDTCEDLDNKITPKMIAQNHLSAQQVQMVRGQKLSHLKQMKEQRDEFDSHKANAMQHPLFEWCVTLDGMDQNKTQLPWRARYSKTQEGYTRIKLHWIGAFCFGGTEPVLGLMNTPELRKDASLSVVTLLRILEVQWEKLESMHRAEQRVEEHRSEAATQASQEAVLAADGAAAAAAPAAVAPAADGAADGAAAGRAKASSTIASDVVEYSGPGEHWPARLHVTFDNAPSECKNQWMMRFLGLLVFHSVFVAITVTTLLVGHTHDIVDQMFSVWARTLKWNNAETFEKMRDLFRERYHSRIAGLVDLMRVKKEKYDALSAEEKKAFDAEEKEMVDEDEVAEQPSEMLKDWTAFVKRHNLQPHIEKQQVTADIKGWLSQAISNVEYERNMRAKYDAKKARLEEKGEAVPEFKLDFEGHLPPLHNIKNAYCFGIEKEINGDVYLYNRQFAQSCVERKGKNSGEKSSAANHSYLFQQTGAYSTRALLYHGTDPGLHTDPLRMPPLDIPLAPLYATAKAFTEQQAMSHGERVQFDGMLDGLALGQQLQEENCEKCSHLKTLFSDHGVVSRKKDQTEKERTDANKKSNDRGKSFDVMIAHLRDPTYADAHKEHMTFRRFWTPWLTRVKHHIEPARIQRGVIMNPDVVNQPYHPPATELVSGVGEPPVHLDRAERVDQINLHRVGVPEIGHYVIHRSAESREPFYLGRIIARYPSDRWMAEHIQESADAQPAAAASDSTAPAASAAAAAAESPSQAPAQRPKDRPKDFLFKLRYFDLCTPDFDALHLTAGSHTAERKALNEHFWQSKFGNSEKAVKQAMAQASTDKKRPPARPDWLVDLYEHVRFIDDGVESQPISGGTFIAWHSHLESKYMCKSSGKVGKFKSYKLTADTWKRVREDLTEVARIDRVTQVPRPLASASARPAASGNGVRRKRGRRDEDEASESDPEFDPAALAPRPRAAQSRKAASQSRALVMSQMHEMDHESDHDDDAPAASNSLRATMAKKDHGPRSAKKSKRVAAAAEDSSDEDARPLAEFVARAAAAASPAAAAAQDKEKKTTDSKKKK